MKKFCKIFFAAMLLTFSMSITALAGSWKQEAKGWWWQNDDGSYPQSAWQWIDGNGDGIAESYYFDENGYLLVNTTTPDGYTVDGNGAWVKSGVVQRRNTESFQEKSDTRQLYLEAVRKNNELSSMAATSKATMNLTMGGEKLPITMSMDMKFKDLDTSSMKYMSNTIINMLGVDMNSTMFYTDGYYYTELQGNKTKMPMNLDAMSEEVNSNLGLTTDEELLDNIQNLSMTNGENGNRILTYQLNAMDLGSYFTDIYKKMGMDVDSVNIKNMECAVVINPEGYSVSETVKLNMAMTILGKTMDMDMDMQVDYINIGQPVNFTLPSTDGYKEVGVHGN